MLIFFLLLIIMFSLMLPAQVCIAMDTSSITVQAQYSFKGSNNDELCFKKGDIITLTQREEGGWWEGTLGDKTGWFPSNYVKDYAGEWCLSIRTMI